MIACTEKGQMVRDYFKCAEEKFRQHEYGNALPYSPDPYRKYPSKLIGGGGITLHQGQRKILIVDILEASRTGCLIRPRSIASPIAKVVRMAQESQRAVSIE